MKVLFCTTELLPFLRTGGLGEFSNAVPTELEKEGVDISIVTPLYRQVNRKLASITPLEGHEQAQIVLSGEAYNTNFYISQLPESGIPVYFVECDHFFGRDGIYTNPTDDKGFADNFRRYAFFQLAIVHLLESGILSADILHLNDHLTSLMPAMLKSRGGALSEIRTLLTVHDASYQCDADESFAYELGLADLLFEPAGPYKRDGRFNFLKAGVLLADKVVAVSMTYANETKWNQDLGHGLDQEFRDRGTDYFGILNGVDYSDWNSRTDEFIEQNFSHSRLAGRLENKKRLLAKNGLDQSNLDIPTIGMITRLTDNKGLHLLTSIFDKMMTLDLNLVMLGTGDMPYHKLFESIKMRFPHKLGLNLTFSKPMAHQILAASDFFLVPSRYEPCGQHHLIAMRYGAVPIGRATGGLADTVRDVTDEDPEGWGFTYLDYEADALLKTVWRAVTWFKKKRQFKKITQRAMQQDCSWKTTAQNYLNVYRDMV